MQIFIDEVFEKFTEEITDRIFLFIQEDTENGGLLQQYLDTISKYDRHLLNRTIGEQVNDYFSLRNKVDNNGDKIKGQPQSFLIKTEYTKHEKQ